MNNEFMFFDAGLIDCSNFNNSNRESITQNHQRKIKLFKRKEMSLEILDSKRKANRTIDHTRHNQPFIQRECNKDQSESHFNPKNSGILQDVKIDCASKHNSNNVNYKIISNRINVNKTNLSKHGSSTQNLSCNFKLSNAVPKPKKLLEKEFWNECDHSVSPTPSVLKKKRNIVKTAKSCARQENIPHLMAKKSKMFLQCLKKSDAKSELLQKLHQKRIEVRREFQNKPNLNYHAYMEEYPKDQILKQAYDLISRMQNKSTLLEHNMKDLEEKWKFYEFISFK